jgi:LysR family glycine cleavage system transcriptional activator
MTRRLPSVNALKCFEVVASKMSIRKAATVLNVSESAISRQVRILEEQLGLALFHRGVNGLEITEAGQALAESTKTAFDQIATTIAGFYRDQDVVQVRVLPTFAIRWLYPRLHKFNEQYPFVKILIHTRWHDMSSSDSDAELGIRYGQGNWRSDDVVELYEERLVPLCAPTYLAGRELQSVDDLKGKMLLHPQPSHQDWKVWAEGWEGGEIDTEQGLDFDVLDMALRAAESGFGIAMSDHLLAIDAIVGGQLVVASQRTVPSGESYYLVKPSNSSARVQIRVFHEWLCDEMATSKRLLKAHVT